MAGIYIHIPFCKQACSYCDFHFSTSLKNKTELLHAIQQEIALRKDYLTEPIESIYFGGGTPSILSAAEIMGIVETITIYFDLSQLSEVTLEANPDDLTENKIKELRNTPINRLSIGIQSFFNEDLRYMHRAHDSEQAKRALANAQNAGFTNLTIDLIYSTPTLTNENWIKNLEIMQSFHLPHFSAYNLTVEPKTVLANRINSGKQAPVDEKKAAEQFTILVDFAEKNNFSHYEISNFSKDNSFAVHNSNYWKNKQYIGFGPSAHSFNGNSRQWNISNNGQYTAALEKNNLPFTIEKLTESEQYNEYVLTSLRTIWGTDRNEILVRFGEQAATHFEKNSKKHFSNGNLREKGNKIVLSAKGKFFADGIAADLFI